MKPVSTTWTARTALARRQLNAKTRLDPLFHAFSNRRSFSVEIDRGLRRAWFKGEDARRVATAIVPLVNREGGTRYTVRRAVDAIEQAVPPHPFHRGCGQ